MLMLGLLALPADASGAGWTADGSAASAATTSSAAVDAAGDTFVAYKVQESENIDLVVRPAGGSFGAPQVIFKATGLTSEPSLAVDDAGDAVVSWYEISATPSLNYKVLAATRSAAGSVQQLGTLATNTSGGYVTPSVAQNSAGAAVIAWVNPETHTIEAVTRAAAGQPFGSFTMNLGAAAAPVGALADAVDSSGNDVLAFEGNGQAWVLTGQASSWATSPQQVSNGSATLAGKVSLAASGTQVLLAWGQGATSEVFASRGTVTGGLSLPIDLSDSTQNSAEPAAAIDSTGDALVAWEVPPGSGTISTVRSSAAPAGGSFPLPAQTTKVAEVANLARQVYVAMGPTGQAILTWTHSEGGTQVPQGMSWTAGGGFTAAHRLSGAGELDLAPMSDDADPLGDEVATWLSTSDSIQYAAYDAAAPAEAAPMIPASASAGAPVSLTVASPFDVWSPPVAVSWNFGDGAGATGTTVTHAYTHAGVYTVTVAATDALGNTTDRSGSITVIAGPSSPTSNASGSGAGDAGAGAGASATLTLAGPRVAPVRFRRGRRPATIATATPKAKAKAMPAATTISFVLSRAATANLVFEASQPGVLLGRKCSAISKSHRKGRSCTRYVKVPHGVSLSVHAGTDRITFDGVLDGGKRLAPGTYRISLVATASGSRTDAPQHPTFTLLG
jgi:hypothetical protein